MTNQKRWLEIACLVLIIGLCAFVRIRLLDMPLERDEGEYAYAGQLMLQGIPPYKLAYNMKLPGTYAAYALIMAVFGQTIRGIHLGLLIVNALTIVLIYLLGRRLSGKLAGLTAAACYGLLSLSYSVLGLAAHATHFVALFAVGGALCLWHYLEGRNRYLFWSALLFGTAFMMKQQAVFFPIFGFAALLWHACAASDLKRRDRVSRLSLYCAGAALPFAMTCLVLFAVGVFPTFWYWTFSYAARYASEQSLNLGWSLFKMQILNLFGAGPLLWVLLIASAILLVVTRSALHKRLLLIGLLVAGFLCCCPGLYFRPHYFIPLLPALALALGITVEWYCRRGSDSLGKSVMLLVLLLAAAQFIHRQGYVLSRMSGDEVSRMIYQANPFPEAVHIGEYIRQHTKPADKIAVIGSEPEIYFYSQRHSATGYIYTYPLMEAQPYAMAMQREMIAEIEKARPEMVIIVNVSTSWAQNLSSDPMIMNWGQAYVKKTMRPILVADITTRGTTYSEFPKVKTPVSPDFIAVFDVTHQ